MVVSAEKEEKDQQNNERSAFEEAYAEQALVHQHDAQPPKPEPPRRSQVVVDNPRMT